MATPCAITGDLMDGAAVAEVVISGDEAPGPWLDAESLWPVYLDDAERAAALLSARDWSTAYGELLALTERAFADDAWYPNGCPNGRPTPEKLREEAAAFICDLRDEPPPEGSITEPEFEAPESPSEAPRRAKKKAPNRSPDATQGPGARSTPRKGQSAIWSTPSAIPKGVLADIRDVLRAGPLSFKALRAKIRRGWQPAREALQALVDSGEVIREGSRGRSVRYRLAPRVDDPGNAPAEETTEDAGHLVLPELAAALEPARATESTGILKGRIRKEIEGLERQYLGGDHA